MLAAVTSAGQSATKSRIRITRIVMLSVRHRYFSIVLSCIRSSSADVWSGSSFRVDRLSLSCRTFLPFLYPKSSMKRCWVSLWRDDSARRLWAIAGITGYTYLIQLLEKVCRSRNVCYMDRADGVSPHITFHLCIYEMTHRRNPMSDFSSSASTSE